MCEVRDGEHLSPPGTPILWITGIIDSYDALHYVTSELVDEAWHGALWVTAHKRWRFNVKDWCLQNFPGYARLNVEESERVIALAHKIATPPRWWRRSEAWDKAGRPRGKAADRWEAKWDRENPE